MHIDFEKTFNNEVGHKRLQDFKALLDDITECKDLFTA